MKTFDGSRDDASNALPWRERRRQVGADCELIVGHPDDQACADRIRQFVRDSKWEIRKVVAESLASFPESLARELTALLAVDSNAMVRSAAQRSIARRSPASALSSSHPNLIQTELERIERKFGPDARRDAFNLAEKTVFLHVRTAVHDIKNILTHFNVETAPLLNVVSDPSTRSRIQRLEKGRQYLVRLVEMMDDYSRDLEFTRQSEDLVGLVRESVDAARDQVRKEGKDPTPVECEVRGPFSIVLPVSRFQFAMVLTNLIKNAIQSHAISETELRTGRVVVEMNMSDDGVRIAITDTGRGISPSDLQKLLDFVPGGSSKPGGMGYGLPICRRYTEAHGGELTMRSEEDKGTEVVINLPSQQGL
jgi:signal transduction histidine kinase